MGGCAGLLVGHPFDTIKVRLQVDSAGALSGPGMAIRQLLGKEGAFALFKGIETPLIGNVPIQALVFGAYGISLRRIPQWFGTEDVIEGQEPISHHVLAGCIAGMVQCPIICVADYSKIQMQNQIETKEKKKPGDPRLTKVPGEKVLYRNSIDCAIKVSRAYGARTLFRGMGITSMREITYGQYFGMYEWLKRIIIKAQGGDLNSNQVSPLASAIAGAASGLFGWIFIYPLDAVKTRIQAQPANLPSPSAWEIIRNMKAEQPYYRAFTRGLGLTMVRALPVNCVTFVVYEFIMATRNSE
jgi:solute carrier family 25 carnitine/acylcarnitine transporter 20/29